MNYSRGMSQLEWCIWRKVLLTTRTNGHISLGLSYQLNSIKFQSLTNWARVSILVVMTTILDSVGCSQTDTGKAAGDRLININFNSSAQLSTPYAELETLGTVCWVQSYSWRTCVRNGYFECKILILLFFLLYFVMMLVFWNFPRIFLLIPVAMLLFVWWMVDFTFPSSYQRRSNL